MRLGQVPVLRVLRDMGTPRPSMWFPVAGTRAGGRLDDAGRKAGTSLQRDILLTSRETAQNENSSLSCALLGEKRVKQALNILLLFDRSLPWKPSSSQHLSRPLLGIQ